MTRTETTKKFQSRLEDLVIHEKEQKNISQNKIAQEIGLKVGPFSKYLNDNAEIGINGLCKIADYFGVTTDYLLGRSDAYSSDINIQGVCAALELDQNTVEIIRDLNPDIKNILRCLLGFPPFRQILWETLELAGLHKAEDILQEEDDKGNAICAIAKIRIMPEKLDFAEYRVSKRLREIIEEVSEEISSQKIDEYAQAMVKELTEQVQSQYPGLARTIERGVADSD